MLWLVSAVDVPNIFVSSGLALSPQNDVSMDMCVLRGYLVIFSDGCK